MAEKRLLQSLDAVRRRVLAVGMSAGAAWALSGILLLLMLFAWADLALDLPPAIRLTCVWLALVCGVGLLIRAAWVWLRGSTPHALARRMDQATQSGGQILSAVDLLHQYTGQAAAPTLSAALAALAVERAAELAARVRAAAAVPRQPLVWSCMSAGMLLVIIGVVALASPRLVATQWSRFVDPYGDHPPYSRIQFNVEPGDTRIVYGGSLDVRATPVGGTVDHLQLAFRPIGQAEEVVPMFPEPGGTWRATVSQVTAGGQYVLQARGARTRHFRYDVITVPELREVRVRITPPAYTHLPPYTGPVPDRGISGLPGSKVELWARSNRPLSGGAISFVSSAAPQTQPTASPAPVSLAPISPGANEVHGSFTVAAAGKLNLTIVDTASQPSREPYMAAITVLKDERPFVRILDPKENSFATPDARLDVNIAAEDDYGISSLQLYRGLNDMRATAADLPVSANQPTRVSASVPFDLSSYGLVPGDVVKFYARVEDNDPAGAKGSESSVVTLHIISNEDFKRMALAREGLETLEAKYAMAARRLEGIDDQLGRLQDELKKLPADSPLAREKQEAIKKLAKEMKDAAAEVADAAHDELPFDIDKDFRKNLDEIAKSLSDAARKTEAAASAPSASKAHDQLADIRKQLGGKREEFKKNVSRPLQDLEHIFPLIEDQARFVETWQRQQDLAERMKSISDVKPDDPKAKSRMRDLEEEQRQLTQDLNELLDDIHNHAAQLMVITGPYVRNNSLVPPSLAVALAGVLVVADDPAADPGKLKDSLETLQQTALEFVRKVKRSGAIEQMSDAAADLGTFDGAHAAAKAQRAADTLKKFIDDSKSMGEKGRSLCPLAFKPSISQSMSNTIDQLLAAEGMKPGEGFGSSGGFSQRRSTLRNTSLYGRIPTRSRAGGSRFSRNAAGPGGAGAGHGGNIGDGDRLATDKLQASCESDV
ncbi:MAG TPA: hypothetical protein VN541_21540, partial [Tepidisphaeraceae bacterium]|nr:hypothetical protein [Tepidisphaeraceae bacterium]